MELPKRLLTEDVSSFRVFKWDARKIVREGRVFHPAENDYLVSSIYDISNQAFRFPDVEEEKIWVKVKLDEGKAEENRVYKAVVIADKQPTYKKAWLKVNTCWVSCPKLYVIFFVNACLWVGGGELENWKRTGRDVGNYYLYEYTCIKIIK